MLQHKPDDHLLGLVVGCVDEVNNHKAELGSGGVGKFSCSNNSLLFLINNFNNRVVSPPKGKILEGQPPRYSNQQHLKLFIKNNNELLEQINNLRNFCC